MLSERQREIATFGGRSERWTLVSGPVGSGKSHAGLIGWSLWARMHGGHEFGLLTKGRPQMRSLRKELSRLFRMELPADAEEFPLPGIDGRVNTFRCFVGQDKRSEPRLRSYNLRGVLIEEATTVPFELIAAANARTRVGEGAKLLALTNPDGPRHPLKLNYFDKASEINGRAIYTELADNPVLPQSYIDSIKLSYTGHMLQRMVYGVWAAASGLVYPHFLEVASELPEGFAPVFYDVVVDVGESSVTHALLVARCGDGTAWIIDECRHHHLQEGVLDERQMIAKIKRQFAGVDIGLWIVDPAALSFRQALAAVESRVPVGKGYNDWTEGVQEVNHWINLRAIRLVESRLPHLMAELGALVWDEDQADKGNDVPVKTPDHGTDALRYYVLTRTIHESGGRKAWEARKKRELEEKR